MRPAITAILQTSDIAEERRAFPLSSDFQAAKPGPVVFTGRVEGRGGGGNGQEARLEVLGGLRSWSAEGDKLKFRWELGVYFLDIYMAGEK